MTLEQLAAAHGVATSYDDWSGRRVPVSVTAITSALAALGVDASDDAAVATALDTHREARWMEPLPPVVVVRQGHPAGVDVVGDVVALEVVLEDGSQLEVELEGREIDRRDRLVRKEFLLPDLPLGYHRIVVRTAEETASCPLIVVPERLRMADGRHWGWQIQLYAMQSAQSWGVGDYVDLRTICEAAAADGAGAVLVNPLHAETPVLPMLASPYSPSSRVFRSVLALRVTAVPEAAHVDLSALKPASEGVDRNAAWKAKLAALELMWPHHRTGALAEYRAIRGEALDRFGLFCALAEIHGGDWTLWPADLQSPSTSAVAHEGRIRFWSWVQMLVDEQLA
ncbi:MAG: malQ, partial [Frankiales bacterium]|nr:malQ [Frankiales bacterium]